MKKVVLILMLSLFSLTAFAAPWWNGFIWVSSTCVAPSGNFWVYPPAWARPVGEPCRLPSGEYGVVE